MAKRNPRLVETFSAALDQAQKAGRGVRFSIEVEPNGEILINAIEQIAEANRERSEEGTTRNRSDLDRALAAARERGQKRVADILDARDMLSADQMARLLGTTRMTINTKRRNHQLLGLEGAKRGYRFPQWQIGNDGRPFDALRAVFDRLGGDPWAVYRFLVQRHAELGGLTGREALAKGRSAEAIEAAESVSEAFS